MQSSYIHKNEFDKAVWLKVVGEALVILLNSDRKSVSIASLGAFVLPFARLNQIRTFYGYNDYPSAYLTWGYLTDEAIDILSHDPGRMLDIDELNAGDNLVIFDILSNLRNIRPIVDHIRLLTRGSFTHFHGVRYDRKLGRICLKRYEVQRLL